MNDTERTTIRINRILLKQARNIAHNNNQPLQSVINMLILKGIQDISNHNKRLEIGKKVDNIRESLQGLDFTDVLEKSRDELR